MLTAKLALQISMSPQLPAGVDKVLQAINHTEYKYLAGGKKKTERKNQVLSNLRKKVLSNYQLVLDSVVSL